MSYVSNIYAVRDSKGKVIDYNKKKSPAKKPAFPQKKSAAKPVT